MHEIGIVSELVEIVEARAERDGYRRVTRLVLAIGKLSAVMPDAVRFAFDVATEGTRLEGAELEIREVAGRGECRACKAAIVLDEPVTRCDCGAFDVAWHSGAEVQIVEMEVL